MLYRLEFTTTNTMTIEVDSDEEAQAKAKKYEEMSNWHHHHGEKTTVIAVKAAPLDTSVECAHCRRSYVDCICASYI